MPRPKLTTPTINRSGSKINSWTLIEPCKVKRYISKSGKTVGKRTVVWYYKCRCDCGGIYEVSWPDIKSNKSTRCKICNLNEYIINSQEGVKRFGQKNPNYRGSEDVPGRWLSRAKSNAEVRDLCFNVTLEDLQHQWEVQKGLCFYSGVPLIFAKDGETCDTVKHISMVASLDRTDSSKGYTADNITWVSKTINYLKMDLSSDQFIKVCELVYLYNKDKMYE